MKDPLVRCISSSARGLWIDMLCLMHESAHRGFLELANGEPMTALHIGRMTGIEHGEVESLLSELLSAGVYSCTELGTIFSRRMARDESKRVKCQEAGKLGVNPKLKNNEEFGTTLKGISKGDIKGHSKGQSNRLPTPSFAVSVSSSKELKDKETKPPEKPPADHPLNVTEPPKKPYGPPKTDIQKVVSGFKAVMNVPDDDREWDAVYFRRYSRPAADLLRLCGGDVLVVADCIDQVSAAMEKKGLSWTPETIVKHAGDWKNGRLFK